MEQASFKSLSEEFDRSARGYVDGTVPVDLLIAKYSILLKYKAEQPEDRQSLTDTLFAQELRWLKKKCAAIYGGDYTANEAKTLFSRLLEPDSLPSLKRDAPALLADAALELLRASETRAAEKKGQDDTLRALVKVAEQTLAFADRVRAYQDSQPPEAPPKKKDEQLSL